MFLAQMVGSPVDCETSHRLRGGALFLLLGVLLSSCSSTPDTTETLDPPRLGILHYDTAFELADGEAPVEAASIYIDSARLLVAAGRVQAATEVLRYAEYVIEQVASNAAGRAILRVDLVSVWHLLGALDETQTPAVEERTMRVVDELGDLPEVELRAAAALTLLEAQLDNPNAGEESIRRTLDIVYLIDDDATRTSVLVDAAERIERRGGRGGLNPVVQQAIAAVPALDDALLAANLNARLARLSRALGRDSDVERLLQRTIQRAEAGFVVEQAELTRVFRIIDIVSEERTLQEARIVLANISPQRARADSTAWLAWQLARRGDTTTSNALFDEAFELAALIRDEEARAATEARAIMMRTAVAQPPDPGPEIARLLAGVSPATFSPDAREIVIVDLAAAYAMAGQTGSVDRLRGFIASNEEFLRIFVGVAEILNDRDRPNAAMDILGSVQGFSDESDESTSAALRAARVWSSLGEHDRAIVTAARAPDDTFARLLVAIPAVYQPNPATRAELERRAERAIRTG